MNEIFDHIKEIEKNNVNFYDNLSDEQKKTVNFFMLFKWLSYTGNGKQIQLMNHLVNTKLFSLAQHKSLLWKLLCAASNGKNNYKWLKRDLKKQSALTNFVATMYNCRINEVEDILELHSKEELLELVLEANLEKIESDKLKKEINVL